VTWVTWWDSQHNTPFRTVMVRRKTHTMKIAILDDYQDAVRKLDCFQLLADHEVKVFNNTVRGLGQLASRLSEVDALVLIRERTRINSQLLDKLPRLRMISQTGKVSSHIDLAACTDRAGRADVGSHHGGAAAHSAIRGKP
jgi:D-3-phosphoglycerate dehydrogenase